MSNKRRAPQSLTLVVTIAPVVAFLRDLIAEHPVRLAGECPICRHYGGDCFGSRAAALLAEVTDEGGQA